MNKYKYPRTYHFSFSEGATSDDKILKDDNMFEGKMVVISEKMDGENTSIYSNCTFHARSLDSLHKDYHSYLLAKIPTFAYKIPENHRICGEYLYAKHSIYYDSLPDYFMAFGVWKENTCLSWKDTTKILEDVGLITVPILYEGPFDLEIVKKLAKEVVDRGGEGIVVRNADSFEMNDFSKNVAKFVRKGHVQTDTHWSYSQITPNKLKK